MVGMIPRQPINHSVRTRVIPDYFPATDETAGVLRHERPGGHPNGEKSNGY